jgi:hypothetical protein
LRPCFRAHKRRTHTQATPTSHACTHAHTLQLRTPPIMPPTAVRTERVDSAKMEIAAQEIDKNGILCAACRCPPAPRVLTEPLPSVPAQLAQSSRPVESGHARTRKLSRTLGRMLSSHTHARTRMHAEARTESHALSLTLGHTDASAHAHRRRGRSHVFPLRSMDT